MTTQKSDYELIQEFKAQVEKLDNFVKSNFPNNDSSVFVESGAITAKIYFTVDQLYED